MSFVQDPASDTVRTLSCFPTLGKQADKSLPAGIGAAKSLSPLGYAGILAAIFFAGIPSAAWSVWKVGVGRKPIQPEDPEQLFQNATVAVLGGAPHHASEKTSIEEKAASDEKLA